MQNHCLLFHRIVDNKMISWVPNYMWWQMLFLCQFMLDWNNFWPTSAIGASVLRLQLACAHAIRLSHGSFQSMWQTATKWRIITTIFSELTWGGQGREEMHCGARVTSAHTNVALELYLLMKACALLNGLKEFTAGTWHTHTHARTHTHTNAHKHTPSWVIC